MLPSAGISDLLEHVDDRLPGVLDRLVDELSALPSAEAVCVSGSISAGTADLYSDLDLQVVLGACDAEAAAAVREAVARVIDIGDERWTVPNRILSTVSTDWVRIDVTLFPTGVTIPASSIEVWPQVSPVRVVLVPPVVTPDPDGFTRTVTRFLRSIGLIVRDLQRGDLRLGCWATEFLVDELISLMYLEQGVVRGAQKGTYAQLPEADLVVLQSLPVAHPDRESILVAQLAVADEYLRRAHALSARWGATWPQAMFDGTQAFLQAHLGATLAQIPER